MEEVKKDNPAVLFLTAFVLIAGALALPLAGQMTSNPTRTWVIAGIIGLQVILAAANFMHLTQEKKNVWAVVFITLALGCFLLLALMPDTLYDWAK